MSELLTAARLYELANALPTHAEPPPLLLPAWFPTEHLEFADRWARDNGWTGVVRGREEVPRSDAQ